MAKRNRYGCGTHIRFASYDALEFIKRDMRMSARSCRRTGVQHSDRRDTQAGLTAMSPQIHTVLSHAIPHEHRSTTPQKPHDSNGSVSNSEMLSWELHATFVELHPIRHIAPVKEHYTRSERVQCSLMGRTTRSATSPIADTLPRQHGHHD
mgnify:FL=1